MSAYLAPADPARAWRRQPLAARRDLRGALSDLRLLLRAGRGRRGPLRRDPGGLHLLAGRQPHGADARGADGAARGFGGLRRHRQRHGGGARGADVPAARRACGWSASALLFGSCHWILTQLCPRFGIEVELVDGKDLDRLGAGARAARPTSCSWNRRAIRRWSWSTSPRSAELAHRAGAKVIVDNVFATPLLQQPARAGRRPRRLFGHQAHRRPGPLPRRADLLRRAPSARPCCIPICAIPARASARSMPGSCSRGWRPWHCACGR